MVFLDFGNLMWCLMVVGICEVVKKYCIEYVNECIVFGEFILYC